LGVQREPLIFVGTCDLAGIVRGKGFPAADLPARLRNGVGLTHSNIMMSAFGPIYDTPFRHARRSGSIARPEHQGRG
jgi:glutamine synthetase